MTESVTIEFFGIPRRLAGCAEAEVRAGSLREILSELESRFPRLQIQIEGQLAPHYRLSLEGESFISDPCTDIESGAHLILLSADVGG